MRASEKNTLDTNRDRAWGSIFKDVHTNDPKVIETFNRPPYWPVLQIERGEVNRERTTESEEV